MYFATLKQIARSSELITKNSKNIVTSKIGSMNLIKTLRKPYLSIFLSSLILFVSCNQYDDSMSKEENYSLSIDEYSAKQISLTNKLVEIFSKENNIDMKMLLNSPEYFKDAKELKLFLQDANFSESSQVADLYIEIQNNTNNFLKGFDNLNQEKITNKIISHIDKKTETIYSDIVYQSSKHTSCGAAYMTARGRCERNFAISLAASAVSGFFTLGIGTAIGGIAATGILALCMNDASNDHTACIENLQL